MDDHFASWRRRLPALISASGVCVYVMCGRVAASAPRTVVGPRDRPRRRHDRRAHVERIVGNETVSIRRQRTTSPSFTPRGLEGS
jgi:hypothetical protein